MHKLTLSNETKQKITEYLQNTDIQCFAKEEFCIVDGWNEIEQFDTWAEENKLQDIDGDTITFDNLFRYGFSDEYTSCGDCGGVIRTSPDSYSWRPDYWIAEGEISCGDCIRQNPESYIEWLTDNTQAANTLLPGETLEKAGFFLQDQKYETGVHRGMTDNPEEVYEQFKQGNSVIFEIGENSQFYSVWRVWLKPWGG